MRKRGNDLAIYLPVIALLALLGAGVPTTYMGNWQASGVLLSTLNLGGQTLTNSGQIYLGQYPLRAPGGLAVIASSSGAADGSISVLGTTDTNNYSIAIGSGSSAGDYDVAIGKNASGNTSESVVIGASTQSYFGASVGYNAFSYIGVAVGKDSYGNAYATALGNDAQATGGYSIAIGASATASGTGGVEIGGGTYSGTGLAFNGVEILNASGQITCDVSNATISGTSLPSYISGLIPSPVGSGIYQIGVSENFLDWNVTPVGTGEGPLVTASNEIYNGDVIVGDSYGGIADSGVTLAGLVAPVTALFEAVPVTGLAYSRSGTTVTVTQTSHGYTSGQIAEITSATDSGLNAVGKEIAVVNANTWTFQTASTGTATGTLTLRSLILKNSGVASITSNGSGDYTATFTSAFSDTYYKVVGDGRSLSSGNTGCLFMEAHGVSVASSRTVSTVRFYTLSYNGTGTDMPIVSIVIYP